MAKGLKILLLCGIYPEQKKILESEVKSPDFEEIRKTFLKITSIPAKFFFYLNKNFDFTQIVFNSEFHQKIWEKEFFPENSAFVRKITSSIKPISKIDFYSTEDFYRILAKQIIFFKPDVIINLETEQVNPLFFKILKNSVGFKLIGYHGANPIKVDLSQYDAFISTFMPNVSKARAYGIKAELINFCIDPDEIKSILSELGDKEKKYPIVFSGSLHKVHRSRLVLLESIAEEFGEQFNLFTHTDYALTPILKEAYKGEVFGKDHIKTLALSKISINHHGDILPWAHNIRLYEATAAGSLLITDELPGLRNLFEVGREVAAYSSIHECIKLIRKFLEDDEEREKIAKAGQKKTLSKHTYENKLEKLIEMIKDITS